MSCRDIIVVFVLNKYREVSKLFKAEGESWTNFPTKLKDSELSSRYEAHITGLKPSTAYEVRAAVFVGTELAPTVTFGPMYNLTTTCSGDSIEGIPCQIARKIIIINGEFNLDPFDFDKNFRKRCVLLVNNACRMI